jgi:hypothetical protein
MSNFQFNQQFVNSSQNQQQNYVAQQPRPSQQPLQISNQNNQPINNFVSSDSSLVSSAVDPSGSNIYLSLIGLADFFQKSKQYRACIQCLEAILGLRPQEAPIARSFHVQLRTRLNLCRLYFRHTTNANQFVNLHLEKSVLFLCFIKLELFIF